MYATRDQMTLLSRLTDQAAFDSLRKTRTRWVAKGFAIQAIPRAEDAEGLGFCVIASKKTAKSAVVRNRMRRRLKSTSYDVLPRYAAKGYDYMIVARREAASLDGESLRRDMEWCLKRLELLRDDR